ncbi:MAG: P1 family peptidase [Chloroflexota bacterium]|nr:P1 family peptidase [Chloroflexota bacterium]
MYHAITDVLGIQVGHYTDREAATGCTVVLCPQGAMGGVDVRGSSPGTRETDLLRPMSLVQQVQAILLTGGSAFGLDAAAGVMRYLEERGYGFKLGKVRVPIVPAAVIYDLAIGSALVRPGPEEGYQACLMARDGEVEEGSVGAGTGATVGHVLGSRRVTKSGLGTASLKVGRDLIVGALVVVNAFGDVVDPETGRLLAGPRQRGDKGFVNTSETLMSGRRLSLARPTNTTIGVVATNAPLNKEQANKLAQMGHDGLALAVRPCHTMADGDTIFALAVGSSSARTDMTALGAAVVQVVAQAVVRAVEMAESLAGVPAAREVEAGR